MSHPAPSPAETAGYLEVAKELARSGGALIAKAFNEPLTGYDRKTATDPVTETDRAVEAHVFGEIHKRFPGHGTIGEESANDVEHTDAPTWIVDPIDGTYVEYRVSSSQQRANFVHRNPQVCISIGFTINQKVVLGVVYNPVQDQMYEATHDGPSLLNGNPISVSGVDNLSSACILAEYGSDRTPAKVEVMVTNLRSLLMNGVQCVRSNGSCALNMCYVAEGRVDGYQEYGPWVWDMAAGVLIVERAGGVVLGAGGEKFSLYGRSLLACTPALEKIMTELHTPHVMPKGPPPKPVENGN